MLLVTNVLVMRESKGWMIGSLEFLFTVSGRTGWIWQGSFWRGRFWMWWSFRCLLEHPSGSGSCILVVFNLEESLISWNWLFKAFRCVSHRMSHILDLFSFHKSCFMLLKILKSHFCQDNKGGNEVEAKWKWSRRGGGEVYFVFLCVRRVLLNTALICKIVGVPYSCCKKSHALLVTLPSLVFLQQSWLKLMKFIFLNRFKCNPGCLVLLRYVSYFYYFLKQYYYIKFIIQLVCFYRVNLSCRNCVTSYHLGFVLEDVVLKVWWLWHIQRQ